MIKITSAKDIARYYESGDLSQSELKPLLYGLKNYLNNKKFNKSSDAMKIGSAVDLLATGNEEEYEKLYHISQLTKLPSDKVVEVVQLVRSSLLIKFSNFNGELDDEGIEKLKQVKLEDCETEILDAVYKVNYYGNRTDEKRVAGIIKDGAQYFDDLVNSIGKVILSADEDANVTKIMTALRTNSNTAKYFDRNKQKTFKKVTFHYQYPIYFEYEGIACKALLDLVIFIFNDAGDLIKIEPIDLKTTYEDTLNFPGIAKKMRYDIQAAWYTLALKTAFRNMPNVKIAPFKFIVESTTSPGKPLVYVASKSLLEIGRKGRPAVTLVDTNFTFDGESPESITVVREIKGYEQLIADYKYYLMNGFEVDRQIEESKGVLDLNFN